MSQQLQQHLSKEELIDLYYEPDPAAQAHLDTCRACAEEYRQLRGVFALVSANEAPVPEREESYGREVYARLLPLIEAQDVERSNAWNWLGFLGGWTWQRAAAMAMLMVAAFAAGRLWQGRVAPKQEASAPVQERVLLVALGDHLDRSQMVLMELTHAQTDPAVPRGQAQADISIQQQFAVDLVADNRLYRQTAAQVGETGLAGVLEELERVLIEIANSPSHLDEKQLEDLQKRIEKEGIVFKVRVIGSTVREKEKSSMPVTAQGEGNSKRKL